MYTTENYVWGLLVYLLGFLILLPIGWHFTGKIPWSTVRHLTRLVCIVLAVTPAKAYTDMYFLAPAWIVIAFELLSPTTEAGAARPLVPLLLVLGAALAAYFALRLKFGDGNSGTGKSVPGESPAATAKIPAAAERVGQPPGPAGPALAGNGGKTEPTIGRTRP